jgi:hypothetical protein
VAFLKPISQFHKIKFDWEAGWPDCANFRLLDDYLILWVVFVKTADVAHRFGLFFHGKSYVLILITGWATVWAIFSQTRLVTLLGGNHLMDKRARWRLFRVLAAGLVARAEMKVRAFLRSSGRRRSGRRSRTCGGDQGAGFASWSSRLVRVG